MKKFLIIFFIIFSQKVSAQSYEDLAFNAYIAYEKKDYKLALNDLDKIFRTGSEDTYIIDIATRCASLANDKEKAFKYLDMLYKKNVLLDTASLQKDEDFSNLRNEKLWKVFITKVKKRQEKREAKYDQVLRKELQEIYKIDQMYARGGYGKKSTDSVNVSLFAKIEKIIDKHGWVGMNKVGGNQAIFLVIQHADSDVNNQKKYLPLIRDAVKKGYLHLGQLAMLEDRIAQNEGKKQRYGSQIYHEGQPMGPPYAYPYSLDDPDNVDKRRREAGLMPLTIYLYILTQGRQTWDLEKFKKEQTEREKKQNKK